MNEKIKNELNNLLLKSIPKSKQQNIKKWLMEENNLTYLEKILLISKEVKLNTIDNEKITDYLKKIDDNIKDELDVLSIYQNAKLKQERDTVNKKIQILKHSGAELELINANPKLGFNYPFLLFIPPNFNKNHINSLIFHCCNTPYASINYQNAEEFTMINQLSGKQNLPLDISVQCIQSLIIPIIPRFRGYNPEYIDDGIQRGTIDNFKKEQKKLNDKYQMNDQEINYEFNRSDNILEQQVNMCNCAISYLKEHGINMSDKIIIEGHSAGSKTATSLINKYPEKISGYIIGGTTGFAEVKDKNIPGVLYNGELDKNNPRKIHVSENGMIESENKTSYPDIYVSWLKEKYDKSYNEWHKLNQDKSDKDFDIVMYDIRKQHEKENNNKNVNNIFVRGFGHNAIESKEVFDASINFVNKTIKEQNKNDKIDFVNKNDTHKTQKTINMSNTEYQIYLQLKEKQRIRHKQSQKEQEKSMTYNNSYGFVNLLFLSMIIAIITIFCLYFLMK